MDETERRIRTRLRDDYAHYSKKCLKIRTKSGEILPLELNRAQAHVHELVEDQRRRTGKVRAIVVKGRQQGISTYIEGRFYQRVTHSFGVQAFILTHSLDATNNLFKMVQRYHENCPQIVRPAVNINNSKELIFGNLDSGYKIGTAENKVVGRSQTIQYFHGSEVAYWANAAEHAKGILQAVPGTSNTEIFLESTANGVGNYFHQQWQLAESGQSEFIPIFVPWFWQNEYRRDIDPENPFVPTDEETALLDVHNLTFDQLAWRRIKIIELSVGGIDGAKAFMSEYPNTSTEAFQTTGEDSFITPDQVMPARKSICQPYGRLIIGVDPARFGDDSTSIIRRKGRLAYGLESHNKKDTMEVAGLVHRIIKEEHPFKVCIDIGGLGAGVYDRLLELGHKEIVEAVNFGSSPLNAERFINKRGEMWGDMKEWLLDLPSQIPDNDSLHADLCGVRYKFDSKTRLILERKEDMKKRGVRSPDRADALALTFACPNPLLIETKTKEYDDLARRMTAGSRQVDILRKKANGSRT